MTQAASVTMVERAFDEIAAVCRERIAVRDAGFTDEALKWPRSREGLVALCAFNGIAPEQAPRGWHYWPNAGMKACWERVIAALATPTKEQSNEG